MPRAELKKRTPPLQDALDSSEEHMRDNVRKEAEACPDHIHILVEIPPKISVSNFLGFLKGKSSLMIYEKWGNMKYKYRTQTSQLLSC